MSEAWSSQGDDDPDDVSAWMVRRNAQLALRSQADAVARDLWNQTTQDGGELYAGNPSDLTAIGLSALGGLGPDSTVAANDDDQGADDPSYGAAGSPVAGPHPPTVGTNYGAAPPPSQAPGPGQPAPATTDVPAVSELEVMGPRPTPAPHPGFLDSLNHNEAARIASGVAGYAVGLPLGVLRGGLHAVQGVGNALNFVGSLAFPEGRAQAWNEAKAATHDALQYGRSVMANPSHLENDLATQGKAAIHNLVPFTSHADNAVDEFKNDLGVGMNDAETAANVVGFVAAPEVFGSIRAARMFAATREAEVAEMMARGLDEPTARYLSKRYKGEGDHAIVQKSQKSILGFETPSLEDKSIPKWFMDGPLNVSRPRGLSQYGFYKHHYGVDPDFYGATLPPHLNGGKGLSGRRSGFERYSDPGRTWARIPPIWKEYPAGVALGDVLRQLPQAAAEPPQ